MSITVEVTHSGLDIAVFAEKLKDDILPALVSRLIDFAYADLVSRASVRTGALLASIQKQTSGLSGSVGPTVPYAVYVEYGTAPHDIRPVNAKVLAFPIGGRMVFTSIVHHPGTKRNPFIEATAGDVKDQVQYVWQDLLWEATS